MRTVTVEAATLLQRDGRYVFPGGRYRVGRAAAGQIHGFHGHGRGPGRVRAGLPERGEYRRRYGRAFAHLRLDGVVLVVAGSRRSRGCR